MKGTGTIVQEARWPPGLVEEDAEILVPTEIQSPNRQASSNSLYQLSYRVPTDTVQLEHIYIYILVK